MSGSQGRRRPVKRVKASRRPREAELIHDWNAAGAPPPPPHRVEVSDETLRDGLQSASAKDPVAEVKCELLSLMDRLGVGAASLGMPCTGERAGNASLELLLLNIRLLGWGAGNLKGLVPYARGVSEALGLAVPRHRPLVGEDAFRTATGVPATEALCRALLRAARQSAEVLPDERLRALCEEAGAGPRKWRKGRIFGRVS